MTADLNGRLEALLAEVGTLPARVAPRLEFSRAEALLRALQGDVQPATRPTPPRLAPVAPATTDGEFLEEDDMVVVLDSAPPIPLVAPRGAQNREVLMPVRVSGPPSMSRFDPLAEAVSSAAMHAEARRNDNPPPVPKEAEFDIVLSEDDMLDVDPTHPPAPPRLPTVAELLGDD